MTSEPIPFYQTSLFWLTARCNFMDCCCCYCCAPKPTQTPPPFIPPPSSYYCNSSPFYILPFHRHRRHHPAQARYISPPHCPRKTEQHYYSVHSRLFRYRLPDLAIPQTVCCSPLRLGPSFVLAKSCTQTLELYYRLLLPFDICDISLDAIDTY